LARIRVAQGRHAEAANLLLQCLSILEKAVVPTHAKRLDRRAEYAKVLHLPAATKKQSNGSRRRQKSRCSKKRTGDTPPAFPNHLGGNGPGQESKQSRSKSCFGWGAGRTGRANSAPC
jgi:hypothetical protein